MIKNIKQFKNKFYFLISNKDKKDIRFVLILGFIVGLFELIGLTLLVLMIQVFTNDSIRESNSLLRYVFDSLSNSNTSAFILIITSTVFVFYVVKLFVSLINARYMAKLASNLYIDVSKKLFENYMNYYYRDFAKRNTAEINQILVVESDNLSLMISNIIYIIIHTVIIGLLYGYMFYVDWMLTISVSVMFAFIIYLYKKLLKRKLVIMGEERIEAVTDYMKFIKSTFSNFKFIKGLDGEYIEKNLTSITNHYKKARVDMLFWAELPRLILEFIIIAMMIIIFMFIKLKYEDNGELLVVVSAYALALFRMLPSLSKILQGANIVNMYKKTLDMVHTEINYKIEQKSIGDPIVFNDLIQLKDVTFAYPESDKKSLSGIDIDIKNGDKVAIIGESGSGKSTLMDILIGLHLPNSGKFIIDGIEINENNVINWRQSTSFVPQKVVLFESDVKENVTFGKEYNEQLFKEVLEDAFVYDVVMAKGGMEAKVGDEISGFSGGQMQRLAFARSLYQEREILFLDEATSSLHEEIEEKILDRLLEKYKNKTIIAIIHKEHLAAKFDKIIKVEDGKIA
ncbi:MAG: hypothetical protein C0602_10535 [Denitrovibrio sp.]|nr:MAG: hypothetical protein C0602_10535 [Denitrovibrio sp.]